MTDEETDKLYEELLSHYGEKLADWETFPQVFYNQVKTYLYYKGSTKNENSNSNGARH